MAPPPRRIDPIGESARVFKPVENKIQVALRDENGEYLANLYLKHPDTTPTLRSTLEALLTASSEAKPARLIDSMILPKHGITYTKTEIHAAVQEIRQKALEILDSAHMFKTDILNHQRQLCHMTRKFFPDAVETTHQTYQVQAAMPSPR